MINSFFPRQTPRPPRPPSDPGIAPSPPTGLSSRGSTEAVDLSYEGTTSEILSAYLSNSN